ncbi:MAG: OmpA family protein [Chitinophagaceae bacterium]|nr:OmpA family protein [Chitinophagaceae bacterium]
MTKIQIRFFAIIFLLFPFFLHAQVRLGILGGPHSASIFETNSVPGWSDNVKQYYSSRFSFHAGLVGDIPFSSKSPLHFQPGLIYSAKGRKFATPSNFDLIAIEFQNVKFVHQQQYISYLDIPLNLVLKFPVGRDSRFIFGGGPQPSLLIGGKETTIVEDGALLVGETNKPVKGTGPGNYKGLDFSLNALMGFEFGRFFITVNYARSFGNFYTAKDYNGNFRHNIIGGTVGIFFGKSKTAKEKDTDKDGILNINDECPTLAGTATLNGCPDKDGDGIIDKNDKCPSQAGPLSNNGCPLADKDNDGVPDNVDKCPEVAGLQIYEGCPIPDQDSDGVNDFEDRCPTMAGPASNKGCPIVDTDKDGIPDKDDKCPGVAGVEKYSGCPVPDTDGDGLNDDEDKCPQAKGPKENNGCPVIKKEITDKISAAAEQIKFASQKADLQNSSYKILDQVVKLLKQNPTLTLTISNYTNVLKTADANQKLAMERANNIMAYIGLQGVDWARMKATGFATETSVPPPADGKNPGNRTELSVLK